MFHHSKRTIFIEYIMLDGVNDQEEHAHQLGKLLETFKAVRHCYITSFYHDCLSLIPFLWLPCHLLKQDVQSGSFAVINF